MNNEIYNILKKYNDNKEFVNDKFVLDICNMIIKEEKLDAYVDGIYTTNSKHGYDTEYQILNSSLYFNLFKAHDLMAKKRLQDTYYWYYNLTILTAIFHELEHVNIEKIINEEENDVVLRAILTLNDPLYIYSNLKHININLKLKLYELFQKINKTKVPSERIANLVSFDKTKDILSMMTLEIDAVKAYNDLIDYLHQYVLIYGYKLINNYTNSPTIDYLGSIPFANNSIILNKTRALFEDDELSLDKRLLCGLYLTKNEYQKIKKGGYHGKI